jgi:hypothetical protein
MMSWRRAPCFVPAPPVRRDRAVPRCVDCQRKLASRIRTCSSGPIGGPFCEYQGHFLRAPDCLAGDAVLIAPVSTQNSLLSGNLTGNIAISRVWQSI